MAEQPYSQEDRFVASALQVWNWAYRNTRGLVVLIALAAVVVFGVRYYLNFQTQLRDAASAEIRAIRFDLQAGETSAVVDRLRMFLVQYDNTPYSREARVLLAHSLLLQHRAVEAIEPAREAADKVGSDPLSVRAAFLLAAAYEEIAETTAAITVYEDIGRRTKYRADRSRGLEGAARLRAASGNFAGAAALYEEILGFTPQNAPGRAYYELRAAEARAPSLVTSGPATLEASSSEGG